VIRLALRVHREQAELVLAELLELAPSGVEEVDVDANTVEYAVYGPPGELPSLPDLQIAAGGALVDVSSTEIADDWSERWREFHKPLRLGRLEVRPPWEPSGGAELDLVIDPAQAFGTGAHATTALCLELLLELDKEQLTLAGGPRATDNTTPHRVIDLGCGSGVLAITAAKLGLGPVLALDYDPLSVEATLDNARVNGVSLDVRRFDLREEEVPAAPLVLANLLAPLLLGWCERLITVPRLVIASGLLETEANRVSEGFAGVGLVEVGRRIKGDWAALTLDSQTDR
jgi:ribosomal protein L11 methyltransferase